MAVLLGVGFSVREGVGALYLERMYLWVDKAWPDA